MRPFISIELAINNQVNFFFRNSVVKGLAEKMGKMATVGLAPAIFGPLMNITGSILASYWHRKPPKDVVDKPTPEPQVAV